MVVVLWGVDDTVASTVGVGVVCVVIVAVAYSRAMLLAMVCVMLLGVWRVCLYDGTVCGTLACV